MGWGLSDVEGTYASGTSIMSSESDARSAGSRLVTAASNVSVGSDHGATRIATALSTFQTRASEDGESFANHVSELGGNTANGAQTGAQTNNEGTQVSSNNTALARDLNTGHRQASAV